MTITIIVYIILLLIFLAVSSLVLRHTIRHGHISPAFKITVIIFGMMAAAIIGLSIYFLVLLMQPSSESFFNEPAGNNGEVSDGLNF